MKLSMMSYTLARRPDLFTAKGMFDLTRELKLDGLDLVSLYDKSAADWRKMADDYGVPIVCHTFFASLDFPDAAGRAAGIDAAKRGIEAAVTLGAPTVMIPTGHSKDRQAGRRNWIAGLKEVQKFAAKAGINLTVENFPGAASPFVIADDMIEAVREVRGMRITYDNGNAATGEDPAESFTRCAKFVVHSHFKDWEPAGEDGMLMLNGRRYRGALIGEGVVDQRACVAAMTKAGYSGYINIEYEGDKYTPEEATRRATPYLRKLIAECKGA